MDNNLLTLLNGSAAKLEELTVDVAANVISADFVDGSVVILCLSNSVYYSLSDVGAQIWSLIQQRRCLKDITEIIAGEYEVDRKRCENDLVALLQDLTLAGLVELKS